MKFPKQALSKPKLFSVSDFSSMNQDVRASQSIKFAVNTEFYNGVIKTRRAVSAQGAVIGQVSEGYSNEFTFTDVVTNVDGINFNLCHLFVPLGNYSYRYTFKLFSADGVVLDLAGIDYMRESVSDIKIPKSILCFSAPPKKGCGIFAYIKVLMVETNEENLEVYELSREREEWILYTDSDMYVPTYFRDGRGTMYHLCEVDLPTPYFAEPLNMLASSCNCFFTTDGVSNMFRLPNDNIDSSKEDYLKFELLADYETKLYFTMDKNSYVSNTVTYGGYDIQISCNNGLCTFFSSPVGFVPQKVYGIDNNLKVTVKYKLEGEYAKSVNMNLGGYYNLFGGARLVLAGNSEIPSLIAVSEANNPFYIPLTNTIKLGMSQQRVVALSSINDSLIILKEGEIYKLEVTSGKIKTDLLCGKTGCNDKKTVQTVHNRLIFKANNNKIYALKVNGELKEISSAIEDKLYLLNECGELFSLATSGKYYLFADNNVLLLDLEGAESSKLNEVWNFWVLPERMRIVGGNAFGEDIALVGRAYVPGVVNYYLANLSNDSEDSYYFAQYSRYEVQKTPITSEIHTQIFDFGSPLGDKFINRLLLGISGEGRVDIDYIGGLGAIKRSESINISCKDNRNLVSLLPFFRGAECGLVLTCNGYLELNKIGFQYNICN